MQKDGPEQTVKSRHKNGHKNNKFKFINILIQFCRYWPKIAQLFDLPP